MSIGKKRISIGISKVSTTERFSIYENGKIISRLYIRDKKDGKHVYLFRLKTNKIHRRNGLAKDLITSAINEYKHRGIILRACHQKDGPSTNVLIKIYRKFGFKRKGKSKTMYLDPPKVWEEGDKTKLHCPNCNSLMRVATLSYYFESVGAYDAITCSTLATENGRKCHKCKLEYVPGDVLRFKGFEINRWNSVEDLKRWIEDVKAGKGKDRYITMVN